MTIGDRIKKKRENLGISQTELARIISVSKQTLYKYENNIITNIPSDKIELIAKSLSTTPTYLMGWESKTEVKYYEGILSDLKENLYARLGSAFSSIEINHLKDFDSLSSQNQRKVEAYTRSLLEVQKVEEEQAHLLPNAAHERTDIEVTDEMRQHDDDIMNDPDF